MPEDISGYHAGQNADNRAICEALYGSLAKFLQGSTTKVWHGAPVWFIEGNPIAGYSVRKDSVQLLFWSGQSFDETGLSKEGTFKAADVRYRNIGDINVQDLERWCEKAIRIQWDYKNIVKRRGELLRLK